MCSRYIINEAFLLIGAAFPVRSRRRSSVGSEALIYLQHIINGAGLRLWYGPCVRFDATVEMLMRETHTHTHSPEETRVRGWRSLTALLKRHTRAQVAFAGTPDWQCFCLSFPKFKGTGAPEGDVCERPRGTAGEQTQIFLKIKPCNHHGSVGPETDLRAAEPRLRSHPQL